MISEFSWAHYIFENVQFIAHAMVHSCLYLNLCVLDTLESWVEASKHMIIYEIYTE